MHRNRFQSYLWRLLLSGWLIAACTNPEDKPPEGLIDEEQMAELLTEIHIAEARVSRLGLRSIDSSNLAYKHIESQLFKKFRVDTAIYRKSYIFYSSHPGDMERVYKKVTEKLKKKTEAPTPKPKPS
ncbi:DUF4296 domain-containing protein [Spirosoma areae]